jgi:hypothetical protein
VILSLANHLTSPRFNPTLQESIVFTLSNVVQDTNKQDVILNNIGPLLILLTSTREVGIQSSAVKILLALCTSQVQRKELVGRGALQALKATQPGSNTIQLALTKLLALLQNVQ